MKVSMQFICRCGVSEIVTITESIGDAVNEQSVHFRCVQTHPDEIHLICKACAWEMNIST